MAFLEHNIDRAIVMTQYDLRGFGHPLGFRLKRAESAKTLSAITANLADFAAGLGRGERSVCTDRDRVGFFESTYDTYLAMCRRLASDCDASQKEAIQLIILEIVCQHAEISAKMSAGTMEDSPYLQPLERGNPWGNAVLALAEAFEADLQQAAAA